MGTVVLQRNSLIDQDIKTVRELVGSPTDAAACRAAIAIASVVIDHIKDNSLIIGESTNRTRLRFTGSWIENPEIDSVGLYYHGKRQAPNDTVRRLINKTFFKGHHKPQAGPKKITLYENGKKTRPTRRVYRFRAHVKNT